MLVAEILERLKQDVPRACIQTKKVGGSTIEFISWHRYCDLLDSRCGVGNWFWSIVQVSEVGNRLVLVGSLTIVGDDHTVTMQATGTENNDVDSYGDPSSNAEAMSLRRCCAKFGLARSLWQKEPPLPKSQISREEWLRRQQTPHFAQP